MHSIELRVAVILAIAAAVMACTAPAAHTPAPTPTLAPTPTGTPASIPPAVATPTPQVDRSLPPDRDLYALAQRLVLKTKEPISRLLPIPSESYRNGSTERFNVIDVAAGRVYQVTATLQLVTDHAYWYMDNNISFDMKALTESARAFEDKIRPRITQALGNSRTSQPNGNPRLTILHAPLKGVAGYFSTADEYPVQVVPHSNQREMIYMDTGALALGSDTYLGTLAHEFTHSIQFWTDPTEDTWVDEGLAEYGRQVAGYPPAFENGYLQAPQNSLTVWPEVSAGGAPHYGAASLFIGYLAERYGADSMHLLMDEPSNGIRGVNAYLAKVAPGKSFQDVFADWIVANFLDDPEGGAYSYPSKDVQVASDAFVKAQGTATYQVPQYGAIYLDLSSQAQHVTVRFQGQNTVSLFPQDPPGTSPCWWSNIGDSIDTTLTRRVKLPAVRRVTLEYSLWYQLEKGWDFAYVEVSLDDGVTWDLLQGDHTVPKDAGFNAFGPGYTGSSNGWIQERVNLTPYAGREVLLRFEYVTDEAIHGPGLCVAGIGIPEVEGFPGTGNGNSAWDARGFVQTTGRVPQMYVLRLIEQGTENRLRAISLDADQAATFDIEGFGGRVSRAVLVVAGIADDTTLPASFQLDVLAPARP